MVPLLIAVYIWVLRRRRVALRYSSLSLVRAALPRYSRWRRHLPFALFLLALVSLIVALARPVQIVSVPTGQATIMLALDVSGSMRQTDIQPSRLEAAQAAALSFIQSQKPSTADRHRRLRRLRRIDPAAHHRSGSAAGRGREPDHGARHGDRQRHPQIASTRSPRSTRTSRRAWPTPPASSQPTPVPKGAYAPDIIVLLTDGVATTGAAAAGRRAAGGRPRRARLHDRLRHRGRARREFRRIRAASAAGRFGGGSGFGGGGGGFRRGIDEATLKQIADMTGGKLLRGVERGRTAESVPEPAHLPDHQARSHGNQRRVRGDRRAAGRAGPGPRPALEPPALSRPQCGPDCR